ncbi:hypothetical protein GCM10007291_22140 [Gemmobacter nanjingensis]|uniref:DUF3168 domain-containing protein n=1 Tax=Gemmobacter nanjingensis TaxID=488454 RepID=A0ABQ3FFY4_9RHOB|nr:hypothetical protein [Gemmobacter nanjingensis]GHC22305.1 hypothetical protein GCM10007291_22140 [Gemmobacter nanjingensis]
MIPEIIAHLKAEVPALQRRVYAAADLANLMRSDAPPTLTPCAHVIPTGIAVLPNTTVVTGAYVQGIDWGIAVVLSLRAHDQNGERLAMNDAQPLIKQVALKLAGWNPAENLGVLMFRGAQLRAFARGIAIYEINFTLSDQLRISR